MGNNRRRRWGLMGENLNTDKKKKRSRIRTTLLIILSLLLVTVGGGYIYLNSLLGKMDKEVIDTSDIALGIGEKIEEHLSEPPIVPPSEIEGEIPTPSGEGTADGEVTAGEDIIEVIEVAGQGVTNAGDEVDKAEEPVEKEAAELPSLNKNVSGITNIALYGVDAPEGIFGRSDTIMILTVDTVHDKIKLTSIVRDAYVYIPGRGMDKITHAYAYGGAQLALRTLNANFQLGIKDFITVNFTTMPKVIDILGGITISVTDKEANAIPGINGAGTYTFTGSQALAFARLRSIDNDFERSRRQRDVMNAVFNKMLSTSAGSYPRIMGQIFPLLRTSLSSGEMIRLAGSAASNGIRKVEQMRFPQASLSSGQRINNRYYYVFDRSQTLYNIHNYIFNDSK